MAATRHYDEELRSIGQELEARDIGTFELKRFQDLYVVRGTPNQIASLRSRMRQWLSAIRSGSSTDSIIFNAVDVEQLSQAGRRRRSKPGQLTNFRSISNILRTIGAYLESSNVAPIQVCIRPITVTLSYRDEAGQEHGESRTIASFYKFFLELYGKRALTQNSPTASN